MLPLMLRGGDGDAAPRGFLPTGSFSIFRKLCGPMTAFCTPWSFEGPGKGVPPYFEVQVWGEIPPSKIKAVEFSCETLPPVEVLKLAWAKGIEVRVHDGFASRIIASPAELVTARKNWRRFFRRG